jgi:hypothetical protein
VDYIRPQIAPFLDLLDGTVEEVLPTQKDALKHAA